MFCGLMCYVCGLRFHPCIFDDVMRMDVVMHVLFCGMCTVSCLAAFRRGGGLGSLHGSVTGASHCSLQSEARLCGCAASGEAGGRPAAGTALGVSCSWQPGSAEEACHNLGLELFCMCTAGELLVFVGCDTRL